MSGSASKGRVVAGGAVAIAAAVALAVLVVGLLLPTSDPPSGARPADTLRVAAANLAFDNERVEEVSAALERLEADVLVVLEWTGENLRLDRALATGWRIVLDAPSGSAHGVLVLVRETIEATAALEPTPVRGPCPLPIATVRLRTGDTWVSLLGVHAPPPIEECEETNLTTLRVISGLVEDGRLATPVGVARRWDPVIVVGDLNASPSSPGLTWLRDAGLVDTYARRRWLPRGTWASATLGAHLVRLDYVLASRAVRVIGAWVVDLPGSDHRAVVSDLLIPPGAAARSESRR